MTHPAPADALIGPKEYAHLLDLSPDAELPDWLPHLPPEFLAIAADLDATRRDGRYTPASVEYALTLDEWHSRPIAISWAVMRALLRQPGSADMFRAVVVEGCRWGKFDALWLIERIPAGRPTAHLLTRLLECVPAIDLAPVADTITRLRAAVTDEGLRERLDGLATAAEQAPRPEDVLDPAFLRRIAPALKGPLRELLFRCEVSKPERPSSYWWQRMEYLAAGQWDDVRRILEEVPGHLAEQGRFGLGEDVVRGLIFFAEYTREGWVVPVLFDIALAAGGYAPAPSRVLANAAVAAMYYRPEARGWLETLREVVPGKALRDRIDECLEYM